MGVSAKWTKQPKKHFSRLEMLEKLLGNMKFGSIPLILQDGKIIQIDKTEKYRSKG